MTTPVTTVSFPRLAARTMNFQLGLPRAFKVSRDGSRVAFLRTDTGTSRTHSLWVYDVETGAERKVADPADLLAEGVETLTAEERARRERMRVGTAGVVGFSTDDEGRLAAFALSSRLFVADLTGGEPDSEPGGPAGQRGAGHRRVDGVREFVTSAPVIDPHIDPTGGYTAYAGDRGVRVVDLGSGRDRLLVGPDAADPEEVAWGLAEFAAAEELDRARGFWWSPDGQSLLVERYDESPVQVWHISDPAHPETPPVRQRYPQAGTTNAVVSLSIVGLTGDRVDVDWRSDRDLDGHTLEYLAHVEWSEGPPILTLLTRDQRRLEYREVDPATGATRLLLALTDEAWVEPLPGTPRRLSGGGVLHGVDAGESRRLAVDGSPFTPEDLLVHSVQAVTDGAVIASVVPRVASIALARLGFDGTVELLSDPAGDAAGSAAAETVVVQQRVLDEPVVTTKVLIKGQQSGVIESWAEPSPLAPGVQTFQVGSRDYPTSVLFPSNHVPGSVRLPVLMDPYGGPHGQRVVNAAHSYLTSQWFADQGFVVVVADGRGMAGRGPLWDRLAKDDFIGTIDDQAEVLGEVAKRFPDDVDDGRVAIRGWSFGGYISALGVLKRPDVFKAAIAGAPCTDMRLYDTCYTERYLGRPDERPDVYEANSLLPLAAGLTRPLMLIHGLSDDNVAVAHTLQLSSALLAAGKPHEVLPLTGMTHMANDEVVSENLLLLQVDFLRGALQL